MERFPRSLVLLTLFLALAVPTFAQTDELQLLDEHARSIDLAEADGMDHHRRSRVVPR